MLSKSSALFSLVLAASVSAVRNSLYVVHEVESPGLGLDGLTPIGVQRAETCIPNVFQNKGIGKIISCTPDLVTGACWTAVSTVQPLADALDLEVDTSCGNGEDADDECVINLINTFAASSTKAILVVWDARDEDNLYEYLGIELPESDDDDGGAIYHHDEYVTIRNGAFIGFSSQDCPNIDGQAPGTGVFSKQAPQSVSDSTDPSVTENDPTPSSITDDPTPSSTDNDPTPSSTAETTPKETTAPVGKRRAIGRAEMKRAAKPRQRRSVSRLYA